MYRVDMDETIPRHEHPRPDFVRDTYYCLNGEWQFAFDDTNTGIKERWFDLGYLFDKTIIVPFTFQTSMSGIGPTDEIHPIIWYRKQFEIPEEIKCKKKILLKFSAVDYCATVYVNGAMIGSHKGGYTPFSFDIAEYIRESNNEICVRVEDYPDRTQPRGKQYWQRGVEACFYTPSSGIWQTVYLEGAGEYSINYLHVTPDIDKHMINTELSLDTMPPAGIEAELMIFYGGDLYKKIRVSVADRVSFIPIDMISNGGFNQVHLWSPENPNLYEMKVAILKDGFSIDEISTYFGMRKIELVKGKILLNNSPYYQRLVLDQGYWPDSLITPPDDDAIKKDIYMVKQLGFNGVRKHQKFEDPRFLYWADKMGILVWAELPSAFLCSDDTICNYVDNLKEAIFRDYNHPSIINWVTINESWGVGQIYADKKQQAISNMLYYLTKAIDGSRLCSSNDGWEQVKTDICTTHDYSAIGEELEKHFISRSEIEKHGADWRMCYAKDAIPSGDEAFLITEFGGIAATSFGCQDSIEGMATWGYHDKVESEEEFLERYRGLIQAIRNIPYCEGYCYTQLTDVMQEINGLLTPSREPKYSITELYNINKNPCGRSNQTEAG